MPDLFAPPGRTSEVTQEEMHDCYGSGAPSPRPLDPNEPRFEPPLDPNEPRFEPWP